VKQDIDHLEGALETVLALQPRTYRFKGQEDQRTHYGLIAQELAQVLPDLVHTHAESELYTVSYRELLPFLLAAVQEQQQRIQQQDLELAEMRKETEHARNNEQRIEILQDQFELLESRLLATELGLSGCCGSGERIDMEQPGFGEPSNQATQASLGANQPNPFDGSTWIPYFLPTGAANAELVVTDLQGKERMRLALSGSGYGSVNLSRGDLADGTYLYSLVIDGATQATRRMSLFR
jgi:hypothetical protein